jgi:hypothetical protein
MSVTLQLPRLLWQVTTDDDVVVGAFQPGVVRRYHVCTTDSWKQRTSMKRCTVDDVACQVLVSDSQEISDDTLSTCNRSRSSNIFGLMLIEYFSLSYLVETWLCPAKSQFHNEELLPRSSGHHLILVHSLNGCKWVTIGNADNFYTHTRATT